MRNALLVIVCAVLAACGSSDGGGNAGPAGCSNMQQISFVQDAMQQWYLWNDLLPAQISAGNYESPEELLEHLKTYSPDDDSGIPIDRFSYIGSAAADAAFFGEGQYEGYGFGRTSGARIVQVFAGSPAEVGGIERGQQILELNGRTIAEIEAAEGINAALDASPLTFLMLEQGGGTLTTTIEFDVVTINPIPQTRIIPASDGSGRMVGYVELSTFISTAEPVFAQVFADFISAGVTDIIVDLRYNGGGLVRVSNLLGDYLGGIVPNGDVFSETRFNADRAAGNNSFEPFDNLANSLSTSRIVIIATGSTASASELLTNSMAPYVDVTIVGDTTFGKPVGQVGIEFCGKILRPTAFQTFNADGFGDYFDGLAVDCPAADDISIAVGVDSDPNMIAAMAYLDTGLCPAAAQTLRSLQSDRGKRNARAEVAAPAWREFAGAN
jgi:carboxyl-terminal processing protease